MPKDQQFTIAVSHGVAFVAEVVAGREPAAVFTASPVDAEAIGRGELDVNVAFMQGRIKASGDMKEILGVLRALAR